MTGTSANHHALAHFLVCVCVLSPVVSASARSIVSSLLFSQCFLFSFLAMFLVSFLAMFLVSFLAMFVVFLAHNVSCLIPLSPNDHIISCYRTPGVLLPSS